MWPGFTPPLELAEALLEVAVCAPREAHSRDFACGVNKWRPMAVLGTLAYSRSRVRCPQEILHTKVRHTR